MFKHRLRWTIALLTLLTVLPAIPAGAATRQPQNAHLPSPSGCDAPHVLRFGNIWEVQPTGVDDTANIACALGEAAEYAGRGMPTIELGAGTFYTEWQIVVGFDGTIRGAGARNTSVQPLPGGLDCVSQFEDTGFVFWWVLLDSDVTVSDLTLEIPTQACEEPYIEDIDEEGFGFVGQDFYSMVLVAGPADAFDSPECGDVGNGGLTATRTRVVAPQPDFDSPIFNPKGAFNGYFITGISVPGCDVPDQLDADVLVVDNHASGVGNLIEADNLVNSHVEITHNTTEGVDVGVIVVNNDSSTARIAANRMYDSTGGGVVFDNCAFTEAGPSCVPNPSTVDIVNNVIDAPSGGFGVLAFDNTFVPPQLDYRIKFNRIQQSEGSVGLILPDVFFADVAYNTLTGAGDIGILLADNTSGIAVHGNNLQGLDAAFAGILLDEFTTGNTVYGNWGSTVVDLGTDNVVRHRGPRGPRGAGPTPAVLMGGHYWRGFDQFGD